MYKRQAYAQADYAYVEAGFIGEGNWEWSYGLVRRMIERGTLTDLVFEHGNVLARVDLDGVSSIDVYKRQARSPAARIL